MKIVITSPSLDTLQNVSGISSVARFIMNRSAEHTYVHFELGKKDSESRNLGWFLRILKKYLKWLYLLLAQNDILIHFNLALSKASTVRDSPLILLARLFRKPMVIHVHGGEFLTGREMPGWMRFALKKVFCGQNPKIVLSRSEEETLRQKLSGSNIFVLPNCIDLEEASKFSRAYVKDKTLLLLFLGRISLDKGIDFIFQAFQHLRKRNIRFEFTMAGTGPGEELYIRKFAELLAQDFHYKGVVAGEKKIDVLKSCDIFLLPSFFEGLPMALLESMSFGLVPVTTDVGSMKYVVKNGYNGILVRERSSEEIASAIETLYLNREYMRELGANARQYIFSTYDPTAYFARLDEIYKYAQNS